jgi:hypothetical protein
VDPLNPYAAPRTEVDRGSPARDATAVAVGAAIGVGAAYAVQFFFAMVFLRVLVAQGVPGPDTYARAYESNEIFVLLLASNFFGGVVGGYWSARLSSGRPRRSAVLAGVTVAVFAALQYYLPPYYLPGPAWSRLGSILLPVLAFPVGGWLLRRRPQ